MKHRLVPASAPPEPLELLNARCETSRIVTGWASMIADERRDHAPSGVPEALDFLHRWCPSLADELHGAEPARNARRELQRVR